MIKRHCKKCGGTLFYQHFAGQLVQDINTEEKTLGGITISGRWYCDNCGLNNTDLNEMLVTEEEDAD